jgi:hypothetical protein
MEDRNDSNPLVSLLNLLCRLPDPQSDDYPTWVSPSTREAIRELSATLAGDALQVVEGSNGKAAAERLGCSRNTLSMGAAAWTMLLRMNAKRIPELPGVGKPLPLHAFASGDRVELPTAQGKQYGNIVGLVPLGDGRTKVTVAWDDGRATDHFLPESSLKFSDVPPPPLPVIKPDPPPIASTPKVKAKTSKPVAKHINKKKR